MNWPSKKEVENIRKKYPEGTIIQLIKMNDPNPVPSGTIGIVNHVDDIGNIHCDYLNYRSSLAIVPNKDEFEIIGGVEFIYPCSNCISAVFDPNSQEPYMCHVDNHHAGTLEGLSNNCPDGKEIKFEKVER